MRMVILESNMRWDPNNMGTFWASHSMGFNHLTPNHRGVSKDGDDMFENCLKIVILRLLFGQDYSKEYDPWIFFNIVI